MARKVRGVLTDQGWVEKEGSAQAGRRLGYLAVGKVDGIADGAFPVASAESGTMQNNRQEGAPSLAAIKRFAKQKPRKQRKQRERPFPSIAPAATVSHRFALLFTEKKTASSAKVSKRQRENSNWCHRSSNASATRAQQPEHRAIISDNKGHLREKTKGTYAEAPLSASDRFLYLWANSTTLCKPNQRLLTPNGQVEARRRNYAPRNFYSQNN